LWNLALVLCVAAVTTVVSQKLKQPVVLGYLLAGLVVGPKLPFPLFADAEMITTLSELGVILLMFSLGLELSIQQLLKVAKSGGMVAVIEVSLMVSLGYAIGTALGFSAQESVLCGAIIAISSTTIIAKVFEEQKVDTGLKEIVFGVLVAEDLLAILLVTVLTGVFSGTGVSADMMFTTIGRLVAFLVFVVIAGLLIIPRFVRFVLSFNRAETTVVASMGICFAMSIFAHKMGYSVALGAFLAGSLVAESGEGHTIEHLVRPVRDVFAAIFFVSVGMSMDPALMAEHWLTILVLVLAVVIGKVLSVSIGTFLTGVPTRDAIRTGMSLAQIGELSFIIAGVGVTTGATRNFLYPVAVGVSAFTTLMTPWLVRGSGPVAAFIEHRLPHSVQTFAELYGAWIVRLRESPHQQTFWAAFRRVVRLLLFDAFALSILIIGAALAMPSIIDWLIGYAEMKASLARAVVAFAAFLLGLPFAIGIMRLATSLGSMIAYEAMPKPTPGETETTLLPSGPPRALVITIQTAIVLIVGGPLLAMTSAFLPAIAGAAIFAGIIIALGFIFLRSASHLEGQMQAGTDMVVELLSKQTRGQKMAPEILENAVEQAIPWFGEVHSVELLPGSESIGKTLAEIGLRGRTGATVVAIRRGKGVVMPAADEALSSGDILALTGSDHAIAAARLVLAPPGGPSDGHTELMIQR
jgi:CPA2 family monovalent cation:H+ antiporter-2